MEPIEGGMAYHSDYDRMMEECSSFGCQRYKETSMKVTFADGVRDFRYKVKEWFVDGELLTLVLEDIYYPLQVKLFYRVHEDLDIIERWREAENMGDEPIDLESFYSAEYSMPGDGYQSMNCNGTWISEFKTFSEPVDCGKKVYESTRGATAHVTSPYFILHQNATEETGEVFYGALAYSGNFKVVVEATPYDYVNVLIGISDTDFVWHLNRGESFAAPAVYAGYSADGFGGMSNTMSRFARKKVMPASTADQVLPILYNSWEAMTFDVNCTQQILLAEKAAQIGAELFVMDDGWFGKRNDDFAGLGDWDINPQKFPNGLTPLIDRVKELGMKFGIWIEPEMVNKDSDLYRSHPEWVYRYETREILEGRNQIMLDMTNPEVVAYLTDTIDKLLSENDIAYIKWDMNRSISECASACHDSLDYKSIWYRHTQGFYDMIRALRNRHPNVEFEACASGGGRVDYGAMQYFDEFWTSDNTDALDRLSIQEGYSYLYPIKYMRAWVTDKHRASLSFRTHCSMCGSLGIGMNLNSASPAELEQLRTMILRYKEIRPIVQFGELYRLKSLKQDEIQAVQYVLGEESVFFAFLPQQFRCKSHFLVKLRGLDENAMYRICFEDKQEIKGSAHMSADQAVLEMVKGKTSHKSGAYLMNNGLELKLSGDYDSIFVVLTKD